MKTFELPKPIELIRNQAIVYRADVLQVEVIRKLELSAIAASKGTSNEI